MEYISSDELNKIIRDGHIQTVGSTAKRINGRKIKVNTFRSLIQSYPFIPYTVCNDDDIISAIELTPEFLAEMIKEGWYTPKMLQMKCVKALMNSDEVINTLLVLVSNNVFSRRFRIDVLTEENAKRLIDVSPTLVTRAKGSNPNLDIYAFSKMTDKERSMNFLQLGIIDRAIFYGDLSELHNVLDTEFLLFTLKTVLILNDLPYYMNEQNHNVKKIKEYLMELDNSKQMLKRANFELKLNPELKEDILNSLMPF